MAITSANQLELLQTAEAGARGGAARSRRFSPGPGPGPGRTRQSLSGPMVESTMPTSSASILMSAGQAAERTQGSPCPTLSMTWARYFDTGGSAARASRASCFKTRLGESR